MIQRKGEVGAMKEGREGRRREEREKQKKYSPFLEIRIL